MVNAWATENGLALGQVKTDEKSNEITAIPQLLRSLELEGCIVTIDAMGCQKNIAKEIHEADADYVLALKGNHQTAHQEIESFLQDARSKNWKNVPHDFLETIEKGHGRIETRRYWITEKIQWFDDLKEWDALYSIGMVESIRQIGENTTVEKRFYLSSLKADAKEFARAVRGHWKVENQLHWILDVCFSEDQCRARTGYAAQNFAILRQIALNTLKRDTTKKWGVQGKQKSAGWDNNYLTLLLKNLLA
jgi:predicted transposase YbfD/YdcC